MSLDFEYRNSEICDTEVIVGDDAKEVASEIAEKKQTAGKNKYQNNTQDPFIGFHKIHLYSVLDTSYQIYRKMSNVHFWTQFFSLVELYILCYT